MQEVTALQHTVGVRLLLPASYVYKFSGVDFYAGEIGLQHSSLVLLAARKWK